MNSEKLLEVFEYVASNPEYINCVGKYRFYKNDLDITENEKWYVERCLKFGISGVGKALAKIISYFQKEEYEYCTSTGNSLHIIKKRNSILPKDLYKSRKDYIVLAMGVYDYVSFYAFDNEFHVGICGEILEYPFPYIKEFIDEVIRFRIRYGILDIAPYGVDLLANEFLKAREELLEPDAPQERTRKNSSQ